MASTKCEITNVVAGASVTHVFQFFGRCSIADNHLRGLLKLSSTFFELLKQRSRERITEKDPFVLPWTPDQWCYHRHLWRQWRKSPRRDRPTHQRTSSHRHDNESPLSCGYPNLALLDIRNIFQKQQQNSSVWAWRFYAREASKHRSFHLWAAECWSLRLRWRCILLKVKPVDHHIHVEVPKVNEQVTRENDVRATPLTSSVPCCSKSRKNFSLMLTVNGLSRELVMW